MNGMFEKASRLKLRFPTQKGQITVEDVWELPLTSQNGPSLDTLAKTLNKQVKESGEESFVEERSSSNTKLDLSFDIVKHVIKIRKEENATKLMLQENARKKARIIELIAKKKDEDLEGKSLEELEELAQTL